MPSSTRALPRCGRALGIVSLVLGLALTVTATAVADPGNPGGPQPTPSPTPTPTPTPSPTPTPTPPPEPKGAPGTHAAHDVYGYGFPEAPDCNEATVAPGGCIGDDRGFFQGQCTSWVAFRLSQRSDISFSNWYAGRHWGDARDWARVAKSIGRKPDEVPAVGAVAWFKRGHVAYVEQVNGDGSIVISEMNFDGANGFRFVTVTPESGWPDKFLHLADVLAYDTTAPTVPGTPDVVSHRGRVGLAWRRSADATGVAGYRVLRDGVALATTTGTSYWDRRVSAGQAYAYAVVAVDRAGNASAPARARVVPGAESADRAWVATGDGPALCGRTGSRTRPSLLCTVLTDRGARRVPLGRATDWGHPDSRRFLASDDGTVSYCRTVGAVRRPRAACTTFDPETRDWSRDRVASRRLPLLAADRTWVSTGAGPAVCGRSGGPTRRRLGCAVLTPAGWRYAGLDRSTPWGLPTSRAFVAGDRAVSFCRTVVTGRARLTCTPFYPRELSWGYDRTSRRGEAAVPDGGTWLDTESGPALCGTAANGTGCRVLTWSGWRFVGVGRDATSHPGGSAFVPGDNGGVSWCRTFGAPAGPTYRTACSRLDVDRLRWGRDRTSRPVRALLADNRAWVGTPAGPALCGRTGTAERQLLGCHVLGDKGWVSVTRPRAWDNPGYRAFVPTDDGVAYCRTAGRAGASCTSLDTGRLRWEATRTVQRTDWTHADPF